jgi:hypothetical protein
VISSNFGIYLMEHILTKDVAYKAIQNFFKENKPFVFFGTGTSCAIDPDFGMGALEKHLKTEIPKCTLNKEQQDEWKRVLEKISSPGPDFETSMNEVKDLYLLGMIIEKTAEHITKIDQKNSHCILSGAKIWPAIKLFQQIVNKLSNRDCTLHVGTSNYDLLAEYAFSNAKIPYLTGFCGGVIRELDWPQASQQMISKEIVFIRKRPRYKPKQINHIRLYKVHGSLNTFQFNNRCIQTDIWANNIPSGIERLMITPGTSKYERLHSYRDAFLSEYDNAVRNHDSFLFLGFGFNDTHLVNSEINKKLKTQKSPALIITQDCNNRIKDLLDASDNAWLICKHNDRTNNSTRIYNRLFHDWLYIDDKEFWRFDKFTEILGV